MAGHLGDEEGDFASLAEEMTAGGPDAGPGAVEDWAPGQ